MDYSEKLMAQEAAKQTTGSALITPLNSILIAVIFYTIYVAFLRTSPPDTLSRGLPPTLFRTYTPQTLRPFDGTNGQPIYLAVRGHVFDVTPGRNFYGPGSPYANFAGRDASRGLACGSFDEDMLTKDLDGPLDTLEGLGPAEMEALEGWEERFLEKYDVVGSLVSVKEYSDSEAKTLL